MKVKHLAEAIILQSIEDLWDESHREDCIKFFSGEDFRTCADSAGMDITGQIEILNMVGSLVQNLSKPDKTKNISGEYVFPQPKISNALIRT